ncbi:MAG TPA: carbonic anhydrase family protein [Ignavibacteria bacterium]|nr:carbonic anhydrase family protein [Ignavibacteria bacterium]HMQ99234.1 carbonic anhydrase family protein [Ignavibacteria bacterium]
MKTSKSSFRSLFIFIALVCFLTSFNVRLSAQDSTVTQNKESQSKLTPADALQLMKDGNARFLDGKMIQRDLNKQVSATSKGQYPYAVLLSCIDSRVAPEITFDQGIGDIFDARIAGNFANDDILGSMEYSCKVVGARLILVMGHTECGAIKSTIDDAQLGNITQMLAKIKPAVEKTVYDGEKSSKNYDYVDLVSKENVLLAVENIKLNSPILKEMYDKGEIDIVGCMYNVQNGKVEFYK